MTRVTKVKILLILYSNTQYFEIEEYREAVEYFDVEYFDATEDPVEKRDEILKMIMLD